MEFSKKYKHVGYSYPSVPKGWEKIVEQTIIELEKEMWPWWIPRFIKRWIHYLAMGNTVVFVKYQWAYRLRSYLTGNQIITQVKEKYATLRIYGNLNDKCEDIIEIAEHMCLRTCQNCGATKGIEGDYIEGFQKKGWYVRLCEKCKDL